MTPNLTSTVLHTKEYEYEHFHWKKETPQQKSESLPSNYSSVTDDLSDSLPVICLEEPLDLTLQKRVRSNGYTAEALPGDEMLQTPLPKQMVTVSYHLRKADFAKSWLKNYSGVTKNTASFRIWTLFVKYLNFCCQKGEEPLGKSAFLVIVLEVFPKLQQSNNGEDEEYQRDQKQIWDLNNTQDLNKKQNRRERCEPIREQKSHFGHEQSVIQSDKTVTHILKYSQEEEFSSSLNSSQSQDHDQGLDLSYDQKQSQQNGLKLKLDAENQERIQTTDGDFRSEQYNKRSLKLELKTDDSDSEEHSSDSGFESPDTNRDYPPSFKIEKPVCEKQSELNKVILGDIKQELEDGNKVFQTETWKIVPTFRNDAVTRVPLTFVASEAKRPLLKPSLKREVELDEPCDHGASDTCHVKEKNEALHTGDAKRGRWSESQERVIQNIVQILDLKGYELAPCIEDANSFSRIMIEMLRRKQLPVFLSAFTHSVTCKENHPSLCLMFKRIIRHIQASSHHCAVKEMYGHILRLHLDTCVRDDCEFPRCKTLRESRINQVHKQPENS